MRYRNVLVAFDGSPEAELALAHAVAIAQAYRARLALVAVSPPQQLTRQPGETRSELETRLRAAANGVPDDLRATTRLLDGDPAQEILRAAREGRHDAIVLHAGRVAERLTRDADMVVVVLHSRGSDGGPDLAA